MAEVDNMRTDRANRERQAVSEMKQFECWYYWNNTTRDIPTLAELVGVSQRQIYRYLYNGCKGEYYRKRRTTALKLISRETPRAEVMEALNITAKQYYYYRTLARASQTTKKRPNSASC